MSALTNLFTALANKIRSKTGGSATYTPPQMVSAIDDVYDAGVAAGETVHTQTYTPATNTAANDMGSKHSYRYVNTSGMITPSGNKAITANGTGIDVSSYATASVNVTGTSITPSNSIPERLRSGGLYTPSAAGWAISSYSDVAPSDSSPVQLSSGNFYRMSNAGTAIYSYSPIVPNDDVPKYVSVGEFYNILGSNGVIVKSVPTITSITPSNTTPAAMSTSNNYKPTASGYAISSYNSVTPSSSGTAFSSGMVKMSGSGYAYSSRPSVKKSTAILWTNSSPTSEFASQTITLSSSLDIYDYLIIRFKASNSGTSEWDVYVNVHDFINDYIQGGSGATTGAMGSSAFYNGSGSTAYVFYRPFSRKSATQMNFSNCRRVPSSGSTAATNANTAMIPISVKGMFYYT